MTKTLTAFALVAGLAFGAVGTAASAQTSALGTMEMGLSMLELSVARELTRVGMSNVDVSDLTLNELSALRSIFSDGSITDPEKRQQIQTVIQGRQRVIQ